MIQNLLWIGFIFYVSMAVLYIGFDSFRQQHVVVSASPVSPVNNLFPSAPWVALGIALVCIDVRSYNSH